jgi:hypothetical protein
MKPDSCRGCVVSAGGKRAEKGREKMAELGASAPLELALLTPSAAGALAGFLAGAPLAVRMPLCIGTSLAIIIPTSISSYRAYCARGAVARWRWRPAVISSWSAAGL